MAIWLLKTEPSVYSYDDLERDVETMWDGVTNTTALKNIRAIQEGDIALIYHTGDDKCWIGIADVTKGYYVNPEHDDPKLAVCNVKARTRLPNPVTLAQVKAIPELAEWELVRISRLSVVPVTEEQYAIVSRLAGL